MANNQPSTSSDVRLKTQKLAEKMRHDSTKLRQVLREKCRDIMKQKRDQLYNMGRPGLVESKESVISRVQETFSEALKEFSRMDLLEIDRQSQLEQLEEEPFSAEETDQWFADEYLRFEREEMEALALYADGCLKDSVVCPMCLKGAIVEISRDLSCSACKVQFPFKATLEEFNNRLQYAAMVHSTICDKPPSFTFTETNSDVSLCLQCCSCDLYSII